MIENTRTHVDDIFDSNGNIKVYRPKFPDFVRPAYQYTKSEVGKQHCDKLNIDDVKSR